MHKLPAIFLSFQLESNFGISAAMAEMLMQRHVGEIQLLSAIPANRASKGSYSGLKANGDYC